MHFAFDGHYLSYDVQFLDTKFKAIRAVKKGEKSKSQIATDFGVPANNLSTWLKNKESNIETYQQLNPKRKTRKTSTEMVEAARKKSHFLANVGDESRGIARKLDKTDFKTSNGWIENFKSLQGITF